MTLAELQNKISTWAESTFTHDARGIAIHLLRESVELCLQHEDISDEEIREAVEISIGKYHETSIDEEAADVAILLLSLAGYMGFDLETSIEAKHSVNIVRKWGKPDIQGITEHIE